MATYPFDSRVVSANIAKFDPFGGGGVGFEVMDFGLQMATVTPSILGTLLTTIEYTDASGVLQQLNLAMPLTAGNVIGNIWSGLWYNHAGPLSVTYQYLVPGGTCQVDIIVRF